MKKNIIKKMRIYRGMSQKELAEKSGISYTTLIRYENKQADIKYHIATRIAQALGITLEQMFEEA